MAIIEIRDAKGKTERLTITREKPFLFGTNSHCEIVLPGPGVFPIHGRIRWKNEHFKVQASPEAGQIEVNGKLAEAKTFKTGDELRVGSTRIVLIDDSEDDAEISRKESGGRADGVDWMTEIESARPAEQPVAASRKAKKSANPVDAEYDRVVAEAMARRIEREKAKKEEQQKTHEPILKKIARMLASADQKPGEERILTSPLVVGLAATLTFLLIIGVSLWFVSQRNAANSAYLQAVDGLDHGDYRNAILRFEDFMKRFPKDKRTSDAKVFRELANVRQFLSTPGPSLTNGVTAAREMLNKVSGETKFRDVRFELAELVLKASEGLADRAKSTTNPKDLDETRAAIELHNEIVADKDKAEVLVKKSRFLDKLAEAQAAVTRAATRTAALAEMDAGLEKSSSARVYTARDALIAAYPDLMNDRAVVDKLTKANELIRKNVKFDESTKPGIHEPAPDPLGPAASIAFRAGPDSTRSTGSSDPLVYAYADGFVYGVDGLNGAPLWQTAIGPDSPFAPRAIAGEEPSLVVFDASRSELVRLNGRDGKTIWRRPIDRDQIVEDPPLVLGNQLYQGTVQGNIYVVGLATGALEGTLSLGRRITRTPVADEAGQFLYVTADEANLFILTRDPLSCVAVEYVGHRAGSIPCSPARLGRYLIIVENFDIDQTSWQVYLIDEQGGKIRPVQKLKAKGWTWQTPPWAGSVIWSVTDRGEATVYSVGSYDDKTPLKPIAQVAAEADDMGPTFALARNEHELWRSSSRSTGFEVNGERGSVTAVWNLGEPGPAVAPIQIAEQLAVFTHEAPRQSGTALWGVDPQSGRARWRTFVGVPWPLEPMRVDDSGMMTLGIDGRPAPIRPELLSKGGFVELPIPASGTFRLPSGKLSRLQVGKIAVILPAPDAAHILIQTGSEQKYQSIDLPAPLSAKPFVWGDSLLVACQDGRVYLIDPATGVSRAEPYVEPFDRTKTVRWFSPVRVADDSVVIPEESGIIRRLTLVDKPQPRLVSTGEAKLGSPIVADAAVAGNIVVAATADGKIRTLLTRDLSPAGAWALEARAAGGPYAAGDMAYVYDAQSRVHAIFSDGRRAWTTTPGGAGYVGAPVARGDVVWLLGRDGVLTGLSTADGSPKKRIPLSVLPASGLLSLGDSIVVPVAPGTLRVFNPSSPGIAAAIPTGADRADPLAQIGEATPPNRPAQSSQGGAP